MQSDSPFLQVRDFYLTRYRPLDILWSVGLAVFGAVLGWAMSKFLG
jgi:hypothetical protein